MKYDPRKHNRRSMRLKGYDYAQPGAYFVTLVTQQRVKLFGEIADGKMRLNDYGRVVEECWRRIPEHFPGVALGAFVVMPDHVHGIIQILEPRRSEVLSPSFAENARPADGENNAVTGGGTPPRPREIPAAGGEVLSPPFAESTRPADGENNAVTGGGTPPRPREIPAAEGEVLSPPFAEPARPADGENNAVTGGGIPPRPRGISNAGGEVLSPPFAEPARPADGENNAVPGGGTPPRPREIPAAGGERTSPPFAENARPADGENKAVPGGGTPPRPREIPAAGGEVLSPPFAENARPADGENKAVPGGGTPPRPTLGQIVAYYKYQSTKKMNLLDGSGALTKFWQRNYHERILRSQSDWTRVGRYIEANPSRWMDAGEVPEE